jgi:hypothetical protein
VPTGMNIGVGTSPWSVRSKPARAPSLVCRNSNEIGTF